MSWLFLTASFGQENFHQAAERLILQAKESNLFSHYVHVTDENLGEFAPTLQSGFRNYLNNKTPGYGFFSWKPAIVYGCLKEFPELGVIYVDAGCELNVNVFSRLRLRAIMHKADKGFFFHTLKYPEVTYTKKYVLDFFNLSQAQLMSPQIQATWFLLKGPVGLSIAQQWTELSLSDQRLIDDEVGNEDARFVANRYDQSLLSCIVKARSLEVGSHRPCYKPVSLKSSLNCYFHPIWSARNRSGKSIIFGE